MATITVENGQSIQAAIDSANDEDEIIIKQGIYNERISLTKTITLRGESEEPDKRPVIWFSPSEYSQSSYISSDAKDKCVLYCEGEGSIKNLIIRESADESKRYEEQKMGALVFVNGPISFENVLISDSAMYGLYSYSEDEDEMTLINCEVARNAGIYVESNFGADKTEIHDCISYGIYFRPPCGCPWLDHCKIYNNKDSNIYIDYRELSDAILIYNDYIFGSQKYGIEVYSSNIRSMNTHIYGNKEGNINADGDNDYEPESFVASFSNAQIYGSPSYGVSIENMSAQFVECYLFDNAKGNVIDKCGYTEEIDCKYSNPSEGASSGTTNTEDESNASPSTIIVAKDGSGDYDSIKAAIDSANDGDEIIIKQGSYNERFSINKEITLRGESEERDKMPVIWGTFDADDDENYDDEDYDEDEDYDNEGENEDEDFDCIINISFGGKCTVKNIIVRENESGEVDKADYYDIFETDTALINIIESATLENVIVADCSVNGITVQNWSEPTINNCEIFGNTTGIKVCRNSRPTVTNTKVHDTHIYCVYTDEGNGGEFKDCDFYNAGGSAVSIENGSEPSYENCKIHDSNICVEILDEAGGFFKDCDIYGASNLGIWGGEDEYKCEEAELNPIFENCQIRECEGFGVRFNYKRMELIGCKIFNNKGGNISNEHEAGIISNCLIIEVPPTESSEPENPPAPEPQEPQGTKAGDSPKPAQKFCTNCGSPLEAGNKFCANCGAPVGGTASASASTATASAGASAGGVGANPASASQTGSAKPNPFGDMSSALKASLAQSQADLKKQLEDAQNELKKSLSDSLKGLL